MGLIVGILIGVFCRRYRTALAWCAGFALVVAAFLILGSMSDSTMGFTGKAVIVLMGLCMSLLFLFAGAAGTIAVKRLIARNKAATPKAEVFGPAHKAFEPAVRSPLSGA